MLSGQTIVDQLSKRILDLIPDHPEILEITEAFDLFKVEGFKCDDLEPSLFQASSALSKAQLDYQKE